MYIHFFRIYEWDPDKEAANAIRHGVVFETAEQFDWRSALVRIYAAHSGAEGRYVAVGFIGSRLHVMVWTPRRAAIRIIGLRKANVRESKRYEQNT